MCTGKGQHKLLLRRRVNQSTLNTTDLILNFSRTPKKSSNLETKQPVQIGSRWSSTIFNFVSISGPAAVDMGRRQAVTSQFSES